MLAEEYTDFMPASDGVVASALEVIEIEEVARLLASGGETPFSEAEWAYARSKPDPERRLAARLAAKRAAAGLLGVAPSEVEVFRSAGSPPRLRFSPRAEKRLREVGAGRALVSLTHERRHAAAAVLLLAEGS
jgi:phosphopantetheinyl transferase (holo-ACP synthase)